MGNSISIRMLIKESVDLFTALWKNCPTRIPQLDTVYSEQDQVFREGHLDQFLCTLESIEEQRSLCEGTHSDDEETLFSAFRTLLGSALDVREEHLDIIFSRPFKKATREFM